jgi:hypothetical protein
MSTPVSVSLARSRTGPDFYLRPPLHDRRFLSSCIILTVLIVFSISIVIKAWTHISVYSIAWITFGMFWAVRLFRLMLHSHASLRMLLAVSQADSEVTKPPLGDVLGLFAEVSNGALFLSFFAILGLLMAIALVLSGH